MKPFSMKSLSYLLSCLPLFALIFGCQREEDPAEIDVSLTDIRLSDVQKSETIVVTSSKPWSIKLSPAASSWLSISPVQGEKGKTDVTFSLIGSADDEQEYTINIDSFKSSVSLTITVKPEAYKSKDPSKDGEVVQLQSATRGSGVNVILLGDGFSDRQNDEYSAKMSEIYDYFFNIEPMKTYRNYFNVYYVRVVSENEGVDNDNKTALDVKFGEGTFIEGSDSKCADYVRKTPVKNIANTLVLIAVNSTRWSGTCYMYSDGSAYAYFCLSYNAESLESLVHHEAVGHGMGNLYDEYISNQEEVPDEEITTINNQYQKYGWWPNVDFTNNASKVRWAGFIGNARYDYVGIYEGAYYKTGIWRSEEISCMDDNRAYFNAPSREAIVKRIKKLSGENYSWDEFVSNDKYEPVVVGSKSAYAEPARLHPPVVIEK